MDPNECLANILRDAKEYLYGDQADDIEAIESLLHSLASSVLALDEWLSHEGFLPSRWDKKQRNAQ